MLQQLVFPTAVATILALGSSAMADTLSEKLEKGIYTEETVGDLDAAIQIYGEIIEEAQANRKFAAQAQFRRGQCLLKQGKAEEAKREFQAIVDQFKDSPDQKELVEKARGLLPDSSDLGLIPVPWSDGEHLELRVKLGGGIEIGAFVLSARAGSFDGQGVWDLRVNRNILANAPNMGLSRVLADRETFRPIQSSFRHSLLGTIEGTYARRQVEIQTTQLNGAQSTRKTDMSGRHFDNEQGWHLFRRLPLTDGYEAKVPIFVTFGAGAMDLQVVVTGTETLGVPAGEFECFKLLIKPVQQTFWISTDSKRSVVKFEAGGVTGVLQSIRHVNPGDVVTHTDDELGFSLQMPADWYLLPNPAPKPAPEKMSILMDPEAAAVGVLHVMPSDDLSDEHRASVRAWAEHAVVDVGKSKSEFHIRADSWHERTVNGHPAAGCVADFEHSGRKRTERFVFLLGSSTASYFAAHTEADRFETYREKLDTIINTFKVD